MKHNDQENRITATCKEENENIENQVKFYTVVKGF